MSVLRVPRLVAVLAWVWFGVLPVRANTVTELNAVLLKTASGASMDLLETERAVAMVQLAEYEAANAVHPVYVGSGILGPVAAGRAGAQYAPDELQAAVIEACYRTVEAVAPALAPAMQAERDRRLAGMVESDAKARGLAVGAAAAAAVVKLRGADGADFGHAYKPGQGAGAYQLTSDRPMAGPVVGKMRPFCLESYAALRPPPPAALDSAQMRRDLEEVALLGKDDSKVRTPEQTEIGRFHALPGLYSWTSVARQAVVHAGLGEVESARALALVGEAVVDSQFAAWEAKYVYNLWRPVTAIAAGGGPLQLTPQPGWKPLVATPMIPEYPCAHCALGAGVQTTLEALFGPGPWIWWW